MYCLLIYFRSKLPFSRMNITPFNVMKMLSVAMLIFKKNYLLVIFNLMGMELVFKPKLSVATAFISASIPLAVQS